MDKITVGEAFAYLCGSHPANVVAVDRNTILIFKGKRVTSIQRASTENGVQHFFVHLVGYSSHRVPASKELLYATT